MEEKISFQCGCGNVRVAVGRMYVSAALYAAMASGLNVGIVLVIFTATWICILHSRISMRMKMKLHSRNSGSAGIYVLRSGGGGLTHGKANLNI